MSTKKGAMPSRDAFYWIPECATLKGDDPDHYCDLGFMETDGCPEGCKHFIGKEASDD